MGNITFPLLNVATKRNALQRYSMYACISDFFDVLRVNEDCNALRSVTDMWYAPEVYTHGRYWHYIRRRWIVSVRDYCLTVNIALADALNRLERINFANVRRRRRRRRLHFFILHFHFS